MNERRGNVYENKGPLWKTWGRSWNVYENKGTYLLKAGMLLKRKVVSQQVVGDREGGTGGQFYQEDFAQ